MLSFFRTRTFAVVAAAGVIVALSSAGGAAVAAKLITSGDIKNHTIKQQDMGRNSVGAAQLRPSTVSEADLTAKVRALLHAAGGSVGPQGPPGADGVDGVNGQDGDPGDDGIDGVDGVSGYEIVTSDESALGPQGTVTTATVDCPDGKSIIGGGYSFTSGQLAVRTNSASVDGTSWVVAVNNNAPAGTAFDFSVTAICATVAE